MEKETVGTIFAVVAAVISGIAIPANKFFIVSADPAVFTAVRGIIIGVLFFIIAKWQLGKTKQKSFGKEQLMKNWKYLAAIAVIGGAIAFLLYFTGLKLTTAGRAAVLHKTLPLYVLVLAFIFLREKISRNQLIAMALMIAGIIAIYFTTIISGELWTNPQLGDLLVLGAAFLWAVENVIAKKAMIEGETNFVVSFARMFFGGLILLGIVLLTGKIDALIALTKQQWINIAISTILLFGYVLFFYLSLKHINASKAAAFLLLAPVISLILGIIFLGEPAPIIQLAGSAAILIGAFLLINVKSEQNVMSYGRI